MDSSKTYTHDQGGMIKKKIGPHQVRTWAGKKLAGFCSTQAGDLETVKDPLMRLSQLVVDFSSI